MVEENQARPSKCHHMAASPHTDIMAQGRLEGHLVHTEDIQDPNTVDPELLQVIIKVTRVQEDRNHMVLGRKEVLDGPQIQAGHRLIQKDP